MPGESTIFHAAEVAPLPRASLAAPGAERIPRPRVASHEGGRMNRRLLASSVILTALVSAPRSWAGTTGFSLTHEETNRTFPPKRTFTTGYQAEIGTVSVFSSNTAFLDDDP